jgi:hypothetical protein
VKYLQYCLKNTFSKYLQKAALLCREMEGGIIPQMAKEPPPVEAESDRLFRLLPAKGVTKGGRGVVGGKAAMENCLKDFDSIFLILYYGKGDSRRKYKLTG